MEYLKGAKVILEEGLVKAQEVKVQQLKNNGFDQNEIAEIGSSYAYKVGLEILSHITKFIEFKD
jgi:hypothetical protein